VKRAIFHALIAASVAAAAAVGAGAGSTRFPPEYRGDAEKYLLAPGRFLAEKLHEQKDFYRAQEYLEKHLGGYTSKIEKLAEGASERLEKTAAGRVTTRQLRRLPHVYNVGIWGSSAFLLCLLMALLFGIESIWEALVLGFKVTVTLVCLQAALIFAGFLAIQRSGS